MWCAASEQALDQGWVWEQKQSNTWFFLSLNLAYWVESKLEGYLREIFNPLSPNIDIQILQIDLGTFHLRIRWMNLLKDQSIFLLVIILLNLINVLLMK